jgi:hypothetical protein
LSPVPQKYSVSVTFPGLPKHWGRYMSRSAPTEPTAFTSSPISQRFVGSVCAGTSGCSVALTTLVVNVVRRRSPFARFMLTVGIVTASAGEAPPMFAGTAGFALVATFAMMTPRAPWRCAFSALMAKPAAPHAPPRSISTILPTTSAALAHWPAVQRPSVPQQPSVTEPVPGLPSFGRTTSAVTELAVVMIGLKAEPPDG